jgi:hypothetical protein
MATPIRISARTSRSRLFPDSLRSCPKTRLNSLITSVSSAQGSPRGWTSARVGVRFSVGTALLPTSSARDGSLLFFQAETDCRCSAALSTIRSAPRRAKNRNKRFRAITANGAVCRLYSAQRLSRIAFRPRSAYRSLRSGRALRAWCTLRARWTLNALRALRACWPLRSGIAFRSRVSAASG